MNDPMKTIAVIDKSVMLKKLRNIEELNKESDKVIMTQTEIDRNKNRIAESVCRIIEELTKIYYMVIIPKEVVDEINDAATESTRLIFKRVLSTCNVTIRDKSCDDIFDFAQNANDEFNCSVDIIPYNVILVLGKGIQ